MNKYETAVHFAWEMMITWIGDGRFAPQNEEDIQCFLYHGLVSHLGSARGLHPKATMAKPEVLRFEEGRLLVGDMHFPDMVLGENLMSPDVVIEIKFRPEARKSFYGHCKADLRKMSMKYKSIRHFFVLVDAHQSYVFLDQHQLHELSALSPECEILYYPQALNSSAGKANARKAIETMRNSGRNFVRSGKLAAAKATKGRSS